MAVLENIKEKLLSRVEELIEKGDRLLPANSDDYVFDEPFCEWRINSISLLKTLPLSGNHYIESFMDSVSDVGYSSETRKGLGILKGLKEDIERGMLQNGIELVKAEVFTDFLDMADHLLESGYKDPAAFLVGAVLEGELRNLCKRNSIEFKEGDGISSLNTKLAENNIYSPTVRSQIQAWKKIRDSADHKKFDDYTENQVKDFLSGVRKFIGEYLG